MGLKGLRVEGLKGLGVEGFSWFRKRSCRFSVVRFGVYGFEFGGQRGGVQIFVKQDVAPSVEL